MGIDFRVSCLELVSDAVEEYRPEIVFSFLDESIDRNRVPDFSSFLKHYTYFAFDQEKGPHADALGEITCSFVQDLKYELDFNPRKILIHCHAGVSRSTAACLVAIRLSGGSEDQSTAMEELLRITNKPWPNDRILARAELEDSRCQGLLEAVRAYKLQRPLRLGAYRRFNVRRGLVSPVARVEG